MDVNNDHSRRVALSVSIGGHDATSFLWPYLLSFSYTDNATGKADSLRIELQDRDGKWNGAGGLCPPACETRCIARRDMGGSTGGGAPRRIWSSGFRARARA